MSSASPIPLDVFDSQIKTRFVEVTVSTLGGRVLSTSDDFFASKDNLIKPYPSVSMKGQFGPNGALYDGWESRRHNPTFDWVIIRLASDLASVHYVDVDTSHFSGNESPESSVFGITLSEAELRQGEKVKLNSKDPRWEEIMPVTGLGPNSRHIFELGQKGKEGKWSALMVRMIPDGGMARFRAYGHIPAPKPYTTLPGPEIPPIDLCSALQSATTISCSDANFSPPQNLILPGRGVDMSDGWETRRSQHERGKYAKGGPLYGVERSEWAIIKLGAGGKGVVRFAEVDTAFHPGNYPVACKIEAARVDGDVPDEKTVWTTIVDKKPLGPHRQHYFDVERSVPLDQVFSHVRYSVYPDGGTKRVRVFGYPYEPSSTAPASAVASSVLSVPALPLTPEAFKPYGQVIQAHSFPSSAPKGTDVSVANQGTAAKFHRLAHVKSTYPEGMLKRGGLHLSTIRAFAPQHDTVNGVTIDVTVLERHAHTSQAFIPMGKGSRTDADGGAYIVIGCLNGKDDKPDLNTLRAFLATSSQGVSYDEGIWHHSMKTVDGPMDYAVVEAQIGDAGNILDCENHSTGSTLFKVVVPPYTDKHPAVASALSPLAPTPAPAPASPQAATGLLGKAIESLDTLTHPLQPSLVPIHPETISPINFAPYGQVIQAFPDPASRAHQPDMIVQGNAANKVEKYCRLADVSTSYTAEDGAYTGIGVYRATKKVGLERGQVFDVRLMERHKYTSQAFIPMAKGQWKDKGEEPLPAGGEFLVIVAQNGKDDRPDPATIKSFIMTSDKGLSYAPGVWHHPVLILDSTLDLACVETQIHTGVRDSDARDCELLEYEGENVFGRVAVPL